MKDVRRFLPLVLVIIFGFLLRFVGVTKFPPALNQDEASQGYAAYSLLKTGHDEWGYQWPTTSFKSFLDYKAPLQTYFILPSIALFGLTDFSVRLPSIIVGTLTILVIYLLANELFPKTKPGLMAAFLLAVSPWSISFSRSAMEANLSPLLFMAGLYCYLKASENKKYSIFAGLLWGLNLYAYHSAKVFLPLFICVLLLKQFRAKNFKDLIPGGIALFLISLPIFISLISGASSHRGSELLLTNFSSQKLKELQDVQYFSTLGPWTRFFYNKLTVYWHDFFANYLSYLSPTFWFSTGSGEVSYSNLPNYGLIYFWLIPAIFIGLIALIKKSRYSWLILAWLFLAPLPAAITKDGYHANRAVIFLGLWEIIAAVGIYQFAKLSKHVYILGFISVCFYILNFAFVYPVRYSGGMSQPFVAGVKTVLSLADNYSHIKLPERYELQSYVAFYGRYDPIQFQTAAKNWEKQLSARPDILYLDQLPNIELGKYRFQSLNWPDDIDQNTLYMSLTQNHLPDNRHTLQKIYLADRSEYLEIFDFRVPKK